MKLTLSRIFNQTPQIVTYSFTPERPLRYIAGQFIELTIHHNDPDSRGIRRWFTLSSSPTEKYLSITTKHDVSAQSTFKKNLHLLKVGDIVECSEAMGDFVLPKAEDIPLLLIAGGIGITPYRSMIKWLIDSGQSRIIQLVYSAHQSSDLLFKDILNQPFIQFVPYTATEKLTAEIISELCDGIENKQLYIAGPEPMAERLSKDFIVLGTKRHQIVTDYFPGYK